MRFRWPLISWLESIFTDLPVIRTPIPAFPLLKTMSQIASSWAWQLSAFLLSLNLCRHCSLHKMPFLTLFFLKYLPIVNIRHDSSGCLEPEPEEGVGCTSFIKEECFRENLEESEESGGVKGKDLSNDMVMGNLGCPDAQGLLDPRLHLRQGLWCFLFSEQSTFSCGMPPGEDRAYRLREMLLRKWKVVSS